MAIVYMSFLEAKSFFQSRKIAIEKVTAKNVHLLGYGEQIPSAKSVVTKKEFITYMRAAGVDVLSISHRGMSMAISIRSLPNAEVTSFIFPEHLDFTAAQKARISSWDYKSPFGSEFKNAFLRQNKIVCIKALRNETEIGLRQAKEFIEINERVFARLFHNEENDVL